MNVILAFLQYNCMTTCVYICASLLTNRLAEAGHKVVGVDISERAVKDFFTDNHLPYKEKQIGRLVRYRVSLIIKKYTFS